MTAELVVVALATSGGYGFGRWRTIKGRPRHKHDWEVVDKTVVSGTTIEQALLAAKASSYAETMDDIMEHVKPEGMIVHYRCMCGAEEVKRV